MDISRMPTHWELALIVTGLVWITNMVVITSFVSAGEETDSWELYSWSSTKWLTRVKSNLRLTCGSPNISKRSQTYALILTPSSLITKSSSPDNSTYRLTIKSTRSPQVASRNSFRWVSHPSCYFLTQRFWGWMRYFQADLGHQPYLVTFRDEPLIHSLATAQGTLGSGKLLSGPAYFTVSILPYFCSHFPALPGLKYLWWLYSVHLGPEVSPAN